MVRSLRIVYAALAWLFLAALVLQVFFAGLMLFGEPEGRALHENTGWMLHTAVLLLPVAAALARAGARAIWLTLGLTVATLIQPILTFVRETPAIAALHPVNAILMTMLSLIVAQGALRLARTERIPAAS